MMSPWKSTRWSHRWLIPIRVQQTAKITRVHLEVRVIMTAKDSELRPYKLISILAYMVEDSEDISNREENI